MAGGRMGRLVGRGGCLAYVVSVGGRGSRSSE